MKKYLLSIVIFFLVCGLIFANDDNWHIAKSRHFIVHYKNAKDEFISKLIEEAEDYYNEIADRLGFRRYNFWLWDNRARIYIYDDAEGYQAATGHPSWSSGCAEAKDKIIHAFPFEQGFFDRILPHEMGHIIFREFVGFDNPSIPLWLDEGVAAYQENLNRAGVKGIVKEAMKKGVFVNLEKLTDFNPKTTQDAERVKIFYAEAITLIDYLIKEFGEDSFVYFCKNLRDKKDFPKALNATYQFKNIQELDEAWQEYLQK